MRDNRPGYRFRAPRFGGLKPAVARVASEGGSLHAGYGSGPSSATFRITSSTVGGR